jgi:hypothetical protein
MERDEVFQVNGTTLGPVRLELRYSRSRTVVVPPGPPIDVHTQELDRLRGRLAELELSVWARLRRRLAPVRVLLFRTIRRMRRLFSKETR